MKIYFFPGLGADASLAKYHNLPSHDVEWVNWPKNSHTKWGEFEEELLKETRIEKEAVFIGISFGGMVAQRIARFKKPACIILISSLTKASSLSPMIRIFRPIVGCLPLFMFNMNLVPRKVFSWFFGIKKKEDVSLLFEMASKISPGYFKKLSQLALSFQSDSSVSCPVFKIHGKRDRIILCNSEARDKAILTGGHLISMTHSDEVNSSIIQWVEMAKIGARNNGN